jgi:Domain of unknown function (DUF6798)
MSTTSTRDTDEPQSVAARWCEVLLIVLVFFAIAGDLVPRINEPHYLGRLKHFWDPSWCAGDLFLQSPEAHGLFAWAFGWITRWLSLTATAWAGSVLAWTLLAWAWQRLSWRILPVPLAAVLTAALWVTLTNVANLAGEWVLGGVEAKCFAYVFVLIALRALVDRRWNQVWIALGAASAFHVLVGGWSLVVCGGIWLVEQAKGSAGVAPIRAFMSMLPGLVVGGLLALLGLIPALALNWNEPPEIVAAANRIYVFERLPHHLSLLTLPPAEITARLLRHGLLILCLWGLSRANRRRAASANEPLRLISWYAWGAVALAAIGFAIEIAFWNQPQIAAGLLRYYWFRLTDVAVPLALALQLVTWIAAGFRDRKPWAIWALAAAIGFSLWHVGVKTADRWANPFPPADASMRDPAAWSDACEWIAANTPQDALFLTPRLATTFKWRTGRAEVATHKDIPQDARSMVDWFDRMEDIFYYQLGEGVEPFNSIGELGTERAVALARKYGASYIVSDQDHPLALPAVYPNREHPNDKYVVYAIED